MRTFGSVVLLASLAAAGTANAADAADYAACFKAETPKAIFAACTPLIDDPSVNGENRALPLIYRGRALRQLREFDRAIADFTEALRINRNHPEPWVDRATAYAGKREYAPALADFAQAIRADPGYIYSYVGRAATYRVTGDIDNAVADYGKVIELAPANPAGYIARADAYRVKGEYDAAIADYTKGIDLFTERKLGRADARYFAGRGVAHLGKKDLDLAIADLSEAIAINPRFAAAWNSRAGAWRDKGDNEKAVADFRKAFELGLEGARDQIVKLGGTL
jgi:tetratricopeptide (TPR) repeat protein